MLGAYSPLMSILLAAFIPVEPGHALQVLVLCALVTPPGLWLLLTAARNTQPRGRWWVFGAVALGIVGALPIVRTDWLRALALLTALVLVLVPRPWSFVLAAGLAAAPALLAIWFGHPNSAGFFTFSLLIHGVTLAMLVWLVAKAREARDAREALAREAVIRERLRIDDELRQTLGTALEGVAARASRAGRLAAVDPAASAREIAAATDNARRTLAEARRMVTRYRAVSLRAEVSTAAALLAAAGIRTRVDLPADDEDQETPARLRTALHAGTARLLRAHAVQECVIVIHRRAGRVELAMSADGVAVTP